MIPYLLPFLLYVCEPSHDFFDETIPSLSCAEDECCSDKNDLVEIFPTQEEIDLENDVDQDEWGVQDY